MAYYPAFLNTPDNGGNDNLEKRLFLGYLKSVIYWCGFLNYAAIIDTFYEKRL